MPSIASLFGNAALAVGNSDGGCSRRGLVAKTSFCPGDIVTTFNAPVMAPLSVKVLIANKDIQGTVEVEHDALRDESSGVCSYCMEIFDAEDVVTCPKCELVSYCSGKCCDSDDLHSEECATVCHPQRLVMSGFFRALFQVLCLARNSATYADKFDLLTHHTDDTEWPALHTLSAAVELLMSRGASLGFSREKIIQFAGMLYINQYTRCDDLGRQAGFIFDPTLALINHSCLPNCYLVFRGRQVYVVCWKAISVEEEVFLSYTRFMDSTPERRTNLYFHFRFWCECEGCAPEGREYPYSNLVCATCGVGTNIEPFSLEAAPTLDHCMRQLLEGATEASVDVEKDIIYPSVLACACEKDVPGDVVLAVLSLTANSFNLYDAPMFKQLLRLTLSNLSSLSDTQGFQEIVNVVCQSQLETMKLCLRLLVQLEIMPMDTHMLNHIVRLRSIHQDYDIPLNSPLLRLSHLKSSVALAMVETVMELRFCRVQASPHNPVMSLSLFMMGNYVRVLASDASKVEGFFSEADLRSLVNVSFTMFRAAHECLMFTHPGSLFIERALICENMVREEHQSLVIKDNLVVSSGGLDEDYAVLAGFIEEYMAHSGLCATGSLPQASTLMDSYQEFEMIYEVISRYAC